LRYKVLDPSWYQENIIKSLIIEELPNRHSFSFVIVVNDNFFMFLVFLVMLIMDMENILQISLVRGMFCLFWGLERGN
jgi:hypothetical protein